MTSPMHARAKQVFLQVCELDAGARTAVLDEQCGDDRALRAEVESLLAHHDSRTILGNGSSAGPAQSGIHRARWTTARRVGRTIVTDLLENKIRYVALLAAFALLVATAVWSHDRIRQSLRHQLRDKLQTVLNADIAALDLWLRERIGEVERWARQPNVTRLGSELVSIARLEPSPREALLRSQAIVALRQLFKPYLEQEGSTRFYIIDRTGMVVAAHDDAEVGARLNAAGIAGNALVLAGQTRVIRPFPQGLFTDERPNPPNIPRIAVSTPIRNESGEVVATLSLRMRADDQFTRVLSVAQLGQTGETYALDAQGQMLSDSRFADQLKSLGLIPNQQDARAIFNAQIRDPGVDLTAGRKARLPLAARPFTRAAALAIAGEDGVDIDGYRDYRGVESVGAWRWLNEYGFGVVTEMDYDEAYAPLRYAMIASWAPVVLLLAAGVGIVYSAWRMVGLQRQIGVARQLGQYTLEEKIGEGGMGVVYRARHALLRRPTAVKLLKPELMSEDAIARFEREVQLASQLTHPNTIEIYDYGRAPDGVFFYAMEYLPGISLDRLIAVDGAVPVARAVHILKQVCGSLGEAHALGLVHRDIKPQNIMLCQRGGIADFVKVLDFGLVKFVEDQPSGDITAPRLLIGTPLYIAPERLKNAALVDTRSDVYSLGAVGYYLVTGRSMFDFRSDLDLLYDALNVAPTPPSQLSTAIGQELDRLLMACLAKDPEDRPQNVAEIVDELNRVETPGRWTQEDAQAWWLAKGLAPQPAIRDGSSDTASAGLGETATTPR